MTRTTLGFTIRVTGENAEAARYGGIPVGRVILLDRAASPARSPGSPASARSAACISR